MTRTACIISKLDVSDRASWAIVAVDVVRRSGRIDILVANAAIVVTFAPPPRG